MKKGYIALVTVLAITAMLLIFLGSVQYIGTDGLKSSFSNRIGEETHWLAESCLEDTLVQIHDDSNYSGGSLSLLDGFCTVSVLDTGGGTRNISIEANTNEQFYVNLEVVINITESNEVKEIDITSKQFS